MERATGIEPVSSVWKTEVLTITQRPRPIRRLIHLRYEVKKYVSSHLPVRGRVAVLGGERTRGGAAEQPQQPSRSYDVLRLIAAASEAIRGMSELWIPISARSRPDIAESSRHVLS
jgi:hypothetical protein